MWISHSRHTVFFFVKGLNHDLVKSWNFPLCLFLNKMGFEIMFADHPDRKRALLDEKIYISILHSGHIGIVLKG